MVLEELRQRQLMYLKIYSLALSPCEGYLAAATSAGTIALFKLNKDESENESLSQYCELPVLANKAYSLCSTSQHLICGDSRGIVRAWKWDNLTVKVPITEPAFLINVAEFSRNPDKTFDLNSLAVLGDEVLFVGCGDSNIYSFDLSCGKLLKTMEGHKDFIHQIVYNQAKSQLFSCGEDGLIKIWDAKTAQQVANISPSTRKTAATVGGNWVGCIAVNQSGDFLAFGGGVQAGIYNVPMASYAAMIEPASLQANAALFSGDKLLLGGQSTSLHVFGVDGKIQNEIPLSNLKAVYAIAPCLEGTVTAVAGTGSKIELIRHFAYRSSSLHVC